MTTPNIIEGNILDIEEGIICHQVNCQGVMGAGLAKQIKEKYPGVDLRYQQLCKFEKVKENLLGTAFIDMSPTNSTTDLFGTLKMSDTLWVANLFAQLEYGRSKKYTNYEALKEAVNDLFFQTDRAKRELQVYMPYMIGCGLGGGDWFKVLEYLEPWLDRITFVKLPE